MKISNKEFASYFNPDNGDEVIPWNDENTKYSGFSVIRSYKKDLGFIPAVTKLGAEDTKVLVKVGIRTSDSPSDKIPLFISIGKYSKYRSSHFGINFDDPNAPTKESLNQSENSRQPIDLEDNDGFIMKVNPVSFVDTETNKNLELREIVDRIYNIHLKTISSGKGIVLKVKLNFQKVICSRIIPKFILIMKWTLGILGKEIKNDKEDFAVGLFKPYSFQKHITTKFPYSLPFFNSELRVSLLNIFWISFSLFLLWYFYFSKEAIGEVFSIALSVMLVAIFEFFLPFVFMEIINLLIIFRVWFERMPFKIK